MGAKHQPLPLTDVGAGRTDAVVVVVVGDAAEDVDVERGLPAAPAPVCADTQAAVTERSAAATDPDA
ncbi:MAG: hypothetical protein ACYDA2_00155 [Acidimicrobiales bacterium]